MLDAQQQDKLAKACAIDQPGTAIERWQALCVGALLHTLRHGGRDVTILVGKKTDRKRGDVAIVMAEERN